MPAARDGFEIAVIVAPGFNLAATVGFLDPFRAANYLGGGARFRWQVVSVSGGPVTASNGLALVTEPLSRAPMRLDLVAVSTSWTPEASYGPPLDAVLRRWSRFGATLAGLDTGAFVLAEAGLLAGRRATVHYEHIDAFAETFPDVTVCEDLFVIDSDRLSASGGAATTDLALHVLRAVAGPGLANSAARYVFHDRLRPEGTRQLPDGEEPLGLSAPPALRAAIQAMEEHLEEPLPLPEIAAHAGVSQRQLARVFAESVGASPQRYYTDIRLDRARGLVTQTEMAMREVALACGFTSAEHFSRAYKGRFGLAPRRDRVEGRVPFEFRAWPMHPRADGE